MPIDETPDEAERILIVDDEQSMRVTLAAILRDDGYEVVTAATGEEALEWCEKEYFSAVLMDVRMPGIDGVEAFRRIRCHHPGVRVILWDLLHRISGRHVSGDRRKPDPDL